MNYRYEENVQRRSDRDANGYILGINGTGDVCWEAPVWQSARGPRVGNFSQVVETNNGGRASIMGTDLPATQIPALAGDIRKILLTASNQPTEEA